MQEMIIMPAEQLFKEVKTIVEAAINNRNQNEKEVKLLSAFEACKLFQPSISKLTLHRWTKDGLIPVHRLGGRIYYNNLEVIAAAQTIKKYDRNKTPTA